MFVSRVGMVSFSHRLKQLKFIICHNIDKPIKSILSMRHFTSPNHIFLVHGPSEAGLTLDLTQEVTVSMLKRLARFPGLSWFAFRAQELWISTWMFSLFRVQWLGILCLHLESTQAAVSTISTPGGMGHTDLCKQLSWGGSTYWRFWAQFRPSGAVFGETRVYNIGKP